MYDIASATGSEVSHVIEAEMAKGQKLFQDMFDNMAKNAPAGSESAVTAFKTAVSAGNTALESVQKAVKQASDMAQSNVKTMAQQAMNASKTASKKR